MEKNAADFPRRIDCERLYLRPYRAGDGEMYFAAGNRNRAHLAEYESANIILHLKDETHAERVVRGLAADWDSGRYFFMGIFSKPDERWAGQIYVGPTNWDLPEFVIGFVADVRFEGKGYISEAVIGVLRMLFTKVGAHRVTSDCNEGNIRSYHLLERCGFRREGHLRENKRNPDGTFHGDYLYGLLRREFIRND